MSQEITLDAGTKITIETIPETPEITSAGGSELIPLTKDGVTSHISVDNLMDPVIQQAKGDILGSMTPSGSPSGSEVAGQSYRVSNTTGAEVTYENFLDKNGDPVTQPDKTSGYLVKNSDGWVFSEVPVDVSGLTPSGSYTGSAEDLDNTKADKDKALFIGNETDAVENAIYGFPGTYPSVSNNVADFPNEGYINYSTGAVVASGIYHWGQFDVSGASTVTIKGSSSANAGYAFMREDGTWIAGAANDGIEHTLEIPGTAKWLYQSKNNGDDISNCPVILTQTIIVQDNQFVIKRGADLRVITIPLRPASIVHDGDFGVNGYINKPGTYAIGETVIDPSTFTSGYVQKANGAWLDSGNFKVSDYLPLNGATIVKASGLVASSSAGICFYKADLTFIAGYAMGASNSDISNYPVPYDLDGNIAALSRVTMANSDTTRSVKFIKQVTVMENQLAFIEDGEVSIWTGGSDSAKISGDELIAALPESDGSDIAVNDTYVNSTTGNVIKKLAL